MGLDRAVSREVSLRGREYTAEHRQRYVVGHKKLSIFDPHLPGNTLYKNFRFADQFQQQVPPAEPRFDLDDDGWVDFSDFFRFADLFAQASE